MNARGTLVGVGMAAALASGCSSGERVAGPSQEAQDFLASYDCRDLAEEVLAYEREENPEVDDIEVRDLEVQKDFRRDFEMPVGDDDTLVLQCRGDGQWTDQHPYPVRFSMWVRADETYTVDWAPTT